MNLPVQIDGEELYKKIQNRILTKEYEPGKKLSENKLAEEFSISRMPVREVFKRLEQDGLLTILPQSGTYVRIYTLKEIKSALEIRVFLEALAIRLVIEDKKEPKLMQKYYDEMSQNFEPNNWDPIAFGHSHFMFHKSLIDMTDNELLKEIYEKLRFRSLQKVFFESMSEKEKSTTHKEHHKILSLIREQNPQKAEQYIINHIWNKKRKNLIKKINESHTT